MIDHAAAVEAVQKRMDDRAEGLMYVALPEDVIGLLVPVMEDCDSLLRAYEAVVEDKEAMDELYAMAGEAVTILRAQHAALVETLNDLMAWGVEFDDERLDYISVQVPRASIADAKELLATLGGGGGDSPPDAPGAMR